eukprot:gene14144-18982_t
MAYRKAKIDYNAHPTQSIPFYKVSNPPWIHEKNERVENIDRVNENIVHPWTQTEEDLLQKFETDLATLNVDTKVIPPWVEEPEDQLARIQHQRGLADQYKFNNNIFTPPELTAAQKKKIDEYQMNPPFKTSYTPVEDKKVTAKKMVPKSVTKKPWEYGSLPADPVSNKYAPKPPTSLWSVPPPESNPATEIESSGDPVLDSLRSQLKLRGGMGILGLAKKFKILDDDDSGSLNYEEFRKGMKECEVIDLTERSIRHLFSYFDKDDSGSISYDEFLVGIRGVLNKRRRNLVYQAFQVLDKDRSGEVTVDDMKGVYNGKNHPQVITGEKTENQVLLELLENFDVGGTKDGVVTREEFENYYANISASIDNDDYFELMIRNAWHISGGKGAYENTTNRRVLVTHADGRQSVEEIKNDLGIGGKDKGLMVERLKTQGINAATLNTTGIASIHNQYEGRSKLAPPQRVNNQSIHSRSSTSVENSKPKSLLAMVQTGELNITASNRRSR